MMEWEPKSPGTIKKNILISEFVGKSVDFHDSKKGKIKLYCKYDSPENPNCEDYELDYDCKWGWLMPVYKKFKALNIIDWNDFFIHCDLIDETLLSISEGKKELFDAIVSGIEWYNSNILKLGGK